MDILWKEKGTFEERGFERGESLWIKEQYLNFGDENDKYKRKSVRPALDQDIKAEVAIIGAGLAGVLTAYMLQKHGLYVVVLECNEAGRGMTKNTTAKITSQHGLIYSKIMMYKGEERAWEYAMANQQAIDLYSDIIDELKIDCDYEILPNYIYTLNNEYKIRKEVEAAKKLGLPASFTRDTTLPFRVQAAIKFDDQAQFHPIKLINGVAKHLTIYEKTRVTQIHKSGLIITDKGSVRAKKIVIASHYPFINVPGYYFLRLHQERVYLSTLEYEDKSSQFDLDGMYLDADPDGYTFRKYKDYLVFGTGSHRTGKYQPLDAYARIENAANRFYPGSKVKYTWSNQDCITPDSIPYIGRYSARTPNIYVATGFNKWGMTNSMVSATVISNMITGRKNKYYKVFNPRRLMLSGSKALLKDAAITTISLVSECLKIPHDKLSDIKRGKAGVVRYEGQRVGVYRDNEDNYYYVTTKCPHLGCKLEWNQNELTWDCPCHGSRFDYRGKLINNPAMRDTFDACERKREKR